MHFCTKIMKTASVHFVLLTNALSPRPHPTPSKKRDKLPVFFEYSKFNFPCEGMLGKWQSSSNLWRKRKKFLRLQKWAKERQRVTNHHHCCPIEDYGYLMEITSLDRPSTPWISDGPCQSFPARSSCCSLSLVHRFLHFQEISASGAIVLLAWFEHVKKRILVLAHPPPPPTRVDPCWCRVKQCLIWIEFL